MMVQENGPHPLHHSTTEFLTNSLQENLKGGPEKWNFVKGDWGKMYKYIIPNNQQAQKFCAPLKL